MRNTNKYTKLYSGGVPKFTEDNIFEIEIPINNVAELRVGPTLGETILENSKVNNETSFETSLKQVLKPKDFEKLVDIIRVLEVKREISVQEVMEITQKSRTTAWRYMKILVDLGVLEKEGNTNNMIYRIRRKG